MTSNHYRMTVDTLIKVCGAYWALAAAAHMLNEQARFNAGMPLQHWHYPVQA